MNRTSRFVVLAVVSLVVAACTSAAPGAQVSTTRSLPDVAAAQSDMAAVGVGSLSGIGPGLSELQRGAPAQAEMVAVGIGSLSGIGPGLSELQQRARAQADRAAVRVG